MSKYFVPVKIDGKWWVVENAPSEEMHLANRATRYYAALEACTRYPTLPSDSAYWASKAGVKMTSEEFEVRNYHSVADGYIDYAIPKQPTYTKPQSPTTKELIAGKPIISEAYNDDGTHSHWRLIDPATGDLLWTQNPEEDTHLWTGKSTFTTFALSLPKQDNGDAWDEAWHNFKRDTPHNFRNFKKLLDYFQQQYSISKK